MLLPVLFNIELEKKNFSMLLTAIAELFQCTIISVQHYIYILLIDDYICKQCIHVNK